MEDLSTVLLLGKDVKFNEIGMLHSLTIDEIFKIGFSEYNQNVGMLCMDKKDISGLFEDELEREIEPFSFIFQNCMFGDDSIRKKIIDALNMIFNEPVHIDEQGYFFLGELSEERFVTDKNFNYMIDLVKQQNCIQDDPNKKKPVKPKNKAQQEYFEKLKKVKEEIKSKESNNDLSHIISSVSAKHNSLSLLDIGKLTMYQLIDQYKRLCAIEEYSMTINGMMHGASSDSKVKHWSEPMD